MKNIQLLNDNIICKDNKYLKWYWNIIENALQRDMVQGYVEKHHIYPKGIYGNNKITVTLTAKEHYIVHLVLWWGLRTKFGKGDWKTRKMAWAFTMMNMKGNGQEERYEAYSSLKYAMVRLACNEANKDVVFSDERRMNISKNHAHLKGPDNGMYGRGDLISGEKNGMHGKESAMKGRYFYDIWVEKYGKEEADRRLLARSEAIKESWRIEKAEGKQRKVSPNFGGDVYLKWVEKYGVEEANKRKAIANENKKGKRK